MARGERRIIRVGVEVFHALGQLVGIGLPCQHHAKRFTDPIFDPQDCTETRRMTSLEIEVDVNESHINRVVPGGRVEAMLDAYSDWKIPAKVIAIIPTADRQKATVKVRIGFDQLDPRILPEMAVKVAFQGSE